MAGEQSKPDPKAKNNKDRIQKKAGSRGRSGSEGTGYGQRSKKRDGGDGQRR